jgi:hypothetical protein
VQLTGRVLYPTATAHCDRPGGRAPRTAFVGKVVARAGVPPTAPTSPKDSSRLKRLDDESDHGSRRSARRAPGLSDGDWIHAVAITTAVGTGCPLPMHRSVSRDCLKVLKVRETGSERFVWRQSLARGFRRSEHGMRWARGRHRTRPRLGIVRALVSRSALLRFVDCDGHPTVAADDRFDTIASKVVASAAAVRSPFHAHGWATARTATDRASARSEGVCQLSPRAAVVLRSACDVAEATRRIRGAGLITRLAPRVLATP